MIPSSQRAFFGFSRHGGCEDQDDALDRVWKGPGMTHAPRGQLGSTRNGGPKPSIPGHSSLFWFESESKVEKVNRCLLGLLCAEGPALGGLCSSEEDPPETGEQAEAGPLSGPAVEKGHMQNLMVREGRLPRWPWRSGTASLGR